MIRHPKWHPRFVLGTLPKPGLGWVFGIGVGVRVVFCSLRNSLVVFCILAQTVLATQNTTPTPTEGGKAEGAAADSAFFGAAELAALKQSSHQKCTTCFLEEGRKMIAEEND